MENGKTSLNIRKLKKQVKGITLIALVVTIIVLLILAGVAISLTIGQNGIFSRAEQAANTWRNAETNEQLAMGELEDWMDGYMNGNGGNQGGGDQGDEVIVDTVKIPKGFYYVGGAKDTGLVISDNRADENKYSSSNWTDQANIPSGLNAETGTNGQIEPIVGNQFVWVPVANPENYFIDETATLNTNAIGTGAENEVTTNVYSNLTIRSGDSYTSVKPGDTSSVREPDVLNDYDTDAQYRYDILGFDSTKVMAESFVAEYKAMSDSIKKYKGFYIGRYELTGSVDEPTEKAGKVLTAASSEAGNWYNLYKACQNVVTGKENVKSTMIYGVQWDAVCDWLEQSGFNTDSNSSSWGNYNNSSDNAAIEGAGSKQNTGYSDYWKANNIYDLAGNYYEWTQEADSTDSRIVRGGGCDLSGSNLPATDRLSNGPNLSISYYSSRATLYMS